jgi:prolyl oligopeptidase PreP (S9A serine peptidase family)
MSEENQVNDIWSQQPNESNRHYKFFTMYCKNYERVIERFYDILQEDFNKDSSKKLKLPTRNTFIKWAADGKWIRRRDAYIKHLNQEELPTFLEERKKQKREEARTIFQIKKDKLYKLLSDATRSSDIKNLTIAINNLSAEERQLTGEPDSRTESRVNVTENRPKDLDTIFSDEAKYDFLDEDGK